MNIAYFDCFSGIAGDMILGALLDLGVDQDFLQKELQKLSLSGYEIQVTKVQRNHIQATDILITVQEQQHRNLFDIIHTIKKSKLSDEVKKQSSTIFRNLAEAEAAVHGIPIEEVHFHEVGAVDSILDIVGSVIGLEFLAVKHIVCSPLPLGQGFVTCAHGILPLPAPATVELLKGIPVYSVERTHELVTPTGAAIVKTLATQFSSLPPMKITAIGYGSGKIQSTYPNLLRVYLGEQYQKKVNKKKRKKEKK
jgi:uncharacterized protein (TIGR00299 family) protein